MYLNLKKININTTSLFSIVLVFATTFGIVMHDMHIDKATVYAVSPLLNTTNTSDELKLDKEISHVYHTHVEKASAPRATSVFHSTLPKIKQSRNDSKRYNDVKKLDFIGGGNAVSLWPSI